MKHGNVHKNLLAGAFAVLVCFTYADAIAGYSQGGAFKSPGYGARAWGMGGAVVASIDDESSVYWNPAMMALATGNTIGASYINLVTGTTAQQSQLAYVHTLVKSRPNITGAQMARHAVGAMYSNLRLGIQSGERYAENTLRLAYGYTPDYFITFAIAFDLLLSSSDVPGFSSKGTSMDFGIRFVLTEHTSMGIVARNAFSRYSYNDGTDFRREREFVVGLATDAIPHVTTEGDLVWAHGAVSRYVLGAESRYLLDVLALRAGLAAVRAGESRSVPYFGFGVRFNRASLHYNANLDSEDAFSDTHRFTLSIEF